MGLADRIKPVSYLKANADELIRTLHERAEPLIITQEGEAEAVLQDIHEYERVQETLALLKILAIGQREIAEGKTKPAAEVFARLREELDSR